MRRPTAPGRERGAALLLALVVLLVAGTAGLLVATALAVDHRGHREEVVRTRLTILVDSALAEAVAALGADAATREVPLHPFGDGEIGAEIEPIDASHRRVLARARCREVEHRVEAVVRLTASGPRVVDWRPAGTGPLRP